MKSTRPWVLYTALRLGVFAVVLTVLMLLGLEPWVSAIAAAVVGLCVTYIFFSRQREQVVTSFYEYRTAGPRDADADVEDDLVGGEDVADRIAPPQTASERERSAEPDSEEQGRQAR